MKHGRACITLKNEDYQPIAHVGRAIDDSLPTYRYPPKFRKSQELFNYWHVALQAKHAWNESVILVQDFFSCMLLTQYQMENVVALMGPWSMVTAVLVSLQTMLKCVGVTLQSRSMSAKRHLNSGELKLLRAALLASYGNMQQIRQMVEDRMDKELQEVADRISKAEGVPEVVAWADSNGWTYELASALREDRPDNPKVIALWDAIDNIPALASTHLKSAAAQLEQTAIAIAEQIPGGDAQWNEVAHRLEPSITHGPKDTRKQAIRRFASLADPGKAGVLTTALLLRMAELGDQNPKPIAESLGEYWDAARLRIQNLFGGRAVYVVAVKSQNWPDWVVDHVWFYGGPDSGPPSPLPGIAAEGIPLAEVLDLLEEHMNRNHTRNAAVVELAVPLRALLETPSDDLSVFYCLAFRWRERTEGRGQFRLVGQRVEHLTRKIKARCLEGAVGAWLSPGLAPESLYLRLETELEARLDLPFLRHEADQPEDARAQTLERLLSKSAVPFAVICRPSLPVGSVGHETVLSKCAAKNRELSQLPRQIYHLRAGEAALNHCTVFWDDFDYNPFRLKYS